MLRKCLPNCLPGLWPLWLQLSPDRRLTHSPHGGGGRGGGERGGGDAGRAWARRPRALPARAAWVSVSVVHGGRGQCLRAHMLFPPRYCPSSTAHNVPAQHPHSSNRNYCLSPSSIRCLPLSSAGHQWTSFEK